MKKSRLLENAPKHILKPGPRCCVCKLPAETLMDIRKARAAGLGHRVIAECLWEEGHKIRTCSVRDHFLFHEAR